MKRALLYLCLLGAAVLPTSATRDARADADRPPVSIIQARKLALARVPGTIVNEKLKTKKDRPPTWSIKIRPRGSDRLVKVEIHAESGEILKVKDVR